MEFKKYNLPDVVYFLDNQKFKGLKSIHRTKITNFLREQTKEVMDGEKVIQEDFQDDMEKMNEELKKLHDERVKISGDDFVKPLLTIKNKIKELTSEESDEEFSGDEAFTLNLLYEAFKLEEEQ